MRILLTGARGFVGRHLMAKLHERGHQVLACTHHFPLHPASPEHSAIRWQQVDFSEYHTAEHWLPLLHNIDVVINTVGIIHEHQGHSYQQVHERAPQALFDACEQASVKRVVQLSALGAKVDAETEFLRSKARTDTDLSQRLLDWAIFKPSLIIGPGGDSFERLQRVAAWPVWPLIDGGVQLLQAIDIDDVVKAMIQSVESKWPVQNTFELVGPKALSLFEILQYFRQAQDQNAPAAYVIKLPFRAVHRLWCWVDALLGSWGKRLRGKPFKSKGLISADMLLMLQKGNVANAQTMVQHFGWMPKSVAASLNTKAYREARHQQRWQQHFAFLRYSLAMLWLWTAWVSVLGFPLSESARWLASVAIPSALQIPLTIAAAALDAVIGTALLLNYRPHCTLKFSLMLMLLYSVLITLFLPELWLHPFGPISKNIPLFAASLLLLHWLQATQDSKALTAKARACI
jgi:uncharacterized protein YbjT (DUF2867 family)